MQQETSVMKNFAWCAAITPYRRAPEDTLAHTKTLPLWAWDDAHYLRPGEDGCRLTQALYAAYSALIPACPVMLWIEMHPVDTPPRPRYAGASSASNHRSSPSCRG